MPKRCLPRHRLVIERKVEVQVLVFGGDVGGAETHRFLDDYPAVAHLDRTDMDRPPRTGPLRNTRAASNERTKVPAPVGFLFDEDLGPRDSNLPNRRPLIEQLTNVVAHRHIVDVDERAAFARERDVAELNAAHERSLQAADAEGGREVLIRLTDDKGAQLIFRPAGLKDD